MDLLEAFFSILETPAFNCAPNCNTFELNVIDFGFSKVQWKTAGTTETLSIVIVTIGTYIIGEGFLYELIFWGSILCRQTQKIQQRSILLDCIYDRFTLTLAKRTQDSVITRSSSTTSCSLLLRGDYRQ